jgi:hypothetical protein
MILLRRIPGTQDSKGVRYQAGPFRCHDGIGRRELADRRQRRSTPRGPLTEHGNPEPLLASGPVLGPGTSLAAGPLLGPDSLRRA